MNRSDRDHAVVREILVKAPIERAFRVFTEQLDSWWPREHHIGKSPMAVALLEPHEGGRWFERGEDGSECDWGRVLSWEPPHRLLLAWQINGAWQFDADLAHASHVELRFTAESPQTTRVELTHSGLERHGAEAEMVRQGVASENGWTGTLNRFASAAAAI